jgi:hypothetical protein
VLTPVYVIGIIAVGAFVACCIFAQEGKEWAAATSGTGFLILIGLATIGALFSFVLMLSGGGDSGTGASSGWWTQAQGQQFLAAAFGWLLLVGAGMALRQRQYALASILMVVGAGFFGLWGLLLEAGVSNQGPLAFARP